LAEQFSKPLLSVYKSSNAQTRAAGLAAFTALLKREGLPSESIVSQLTVATTQDRPSADQRFVIVQTLKAVPLSAKSAPLLIDACSTILGKESSEPIQLLLISCLLGALSFILEDGSEIPKSTLSLIKSGINDKKVNVKAQWICTLAELNRAKAGTMDTALKSLVDDLYKLWQADTKAPLQTHQAGSITSTFALTHLLLNYAERHPSGKLIMAPRHS
jgi:hypothetical protein